MSVQHEAFCQKNSFFAHLARKRSKKRVEKSKTIGVTLSILVQKWTKSALLVILGRKWTKIDSKFGPKNFPGTKIFCLKIWDHKKWKFEISLTSITNICRFLESYFLRKIRFWPLKLKIFGNFWSKIFFLKKTTFFHSTPNTKHFVKKTCFLII